MPLVSSLMKKRQPEIVMLGDSITHFWGGEPVGGRRTGAEVWDRFFAGRRVVNLGYGWDRTENVLWRLTHGEFDESHPKVVVVMIGTNNIDLNTLDEIAAGITAICVELHRRAPARASCCSAFSPRPTPDATRAKVRGQPTHRRLDGKATCLSGSREDVPSGRRIDLRGRHVRLPASDREGICHVGRGPVADADAPAVAVTDDRHGLRGSTRHGLHGSDRSRTFTIRQVTDGTDSTQFLRSREGWHGGARCKPMRFLSGQIVLDDRPVGRRATHGDSCNAGRHITSCSQQDVRVSQCPIRSVESVTADP